MRRSKLDLYVSVLNSVIIYGPLNISQMTLRSRLNYVQLKPILNGLMNKDYIRQYEKDGSVFFAPTSLGQQLLTGFRQMDKSEIVLTKQSEPDLLNMLNIAKQNFKLEILAQRQQAST